MRRPIKVRKVDGKENHNGHIKHRTILETTIANKRQWISMLITGLRKQHIILGLPWLVKENPDINYQNGTLQWRPTPLETMTISRGVISTITMNTLFLWPKR